MTKTKYKNRVNEFKKEMLSCRNKNLFASKWKKRQSEAYIFQDWCIETPTGIYNNFCKSYYEHLRKKMEEGFSVYDIKKAILTLFKRTYTQMNKILEETKTFDYSENENLIYDFTFCVVCLSKMKSIESSDTFGIMMTDIKTPLKVINVY